MKNLWLVLGLMFAGSAFAQLEDAKSVSGSCGNKDFKIHFSAVFKADGKSEAYLTGETVAKEQENKKIPLEAKVSEGTILVLQFKDGSGSYLAIDATDYMHRLYWGGFSKTGKTTDEVSLGLCGTLWAF